MSNLRPPVSLDENPCSSHPQITWEGRYIQFDGKLCVSRFYLRSGHSLSKGMCFHV